jgi:hypothetical protein
MARDETLNYAASKKPSVIIGGKDKHGNFHQGKAEFEGAADDSDEDEDGDYDEETGEFEE